MAEESAASPCCRAGQATIAMSSGADCVMQPLAAETVACRPTAPEAPEVNVMELVPAPAVIVPLVIAH